MKITRYKKYGIEFDESEIELPKVIRVNDLKIKPSKLIPRLIKKGINLKKIPYLPLGYEIESEFSPASTTEHLLGYYYIQETASQLPVVSLNPLPGQSVLDMAASPGSKTTQIGQMMKNQGVIIALDNHTIRAKKLVNNLMRIGIENNAVYIKDARYASDLGKFDKVLLDAPCSGNYCIEPNYYNKRSIEDIKNKAQTQKELLQEAIRSTKKGGVIVYSTCSLEIEENEEVILSALETKKVELQDTNLKTGTPGFAIQGIKELKKTKRMWPHIHKTQGFFIAKLIKTK